jgi:crotonobetainyl-CoA:carnitine CoA-transferase CaiB-like acyl-CoA transferase
MDRLGAGYDAVAAVNPDVVYCSLTGYGPDDLRERGRGGRRIVVSLAGAAHRLVAFRAGGDPLPRFLTGGLACYRVYAAADGGWLTVSAVEPVFFGRLCELLGRPGLAAVQYDPDG